MNRVKIFGATSIIALAALASSPAQAVGTLAGTEITNAASISYNVNSVAQAAVTTTDKVTVDRVVNFAVENLSGPAQAVVPGQTNMSTAIKVTNLSNAPLSFAPWATPRTENPVVVGQPFEFYIDSNGNGVLDLATDKKFTISSTDVPVTAPDAAVTWFVTLNIPVEAVNFNGQTLGVDYWVFSAEPNVSGNAPLDFMDAKSDALNTAIDTAGVETVLADPEQLEFPNGFGAARDGDILVAASYLISGASLSVVRSNKVVSDTVNGTTNPKAIPGAIVEYCLAVANAAGATTASNITIADTLAAGLTFDSTYGVYQNGTVTSGTCDTAGAGGGTLGGTFASGKVNGTISSIAAGETKTIRYRATVN